MARTTSIGPGGTNRVTARAPARLNRRAISLGTNAGRSTDAGGFWWPVAAPRVSVHPEVDKAFAGDQHKRSPQRANN